MLLAVRGGGRSLVVYPGRLAGKGRRETTTANFFLEVTVTGGYRDLAERKVLLGTWVLGGAPRAWRRRMLRQRMRSTKKYTSWAEWVEQGSESCNEMAGTHSRG